MPNIVDLSKRSAHSGEHPGRGADALVHIGKTADAMR
jgi:hypothetical protein